ncbi:MAG: hypothetical protein H7A52_18875 [Akkermansiaceae bacterium]|nr:hypothetical protein [Akkermansiaceae bacterium]
MSPPKIDLIFDLLLEEVSEDEFSEKYGINPDQFSAEVSRLIDLAHHEHDGDTVEAALGLGFRYGFPDRFLDEVHRLIPLRWHQRHEDLVGLLQEWRNPRSIPILATAIEQKPALKYLDYDDYGAYYKKCLWALVAIGTDEARDLVGKYTDSKIPELRDEAIYRLSKFDDDAKWSKEKPPRGPWRKGGDKPT